MAKSLAMKKTTKAQAKVKKTTKAKAKGKPKVQMPKKVQKVAEEEEAQKVAHMPKKATAAAKIKAAQMPKKATAAAKIKAIAAAKQEAVAKAVANKSTMKKPSGASWDQWATKEDDADDGEEEEEKGEDSKDCSAPTKAQAWIFDRALKMDAGTKGALPSEIHDLWTTMQSGPGAAQERHALRNAIVPKDAKYGHVCKVDPNGPLMNRIRDVFEIKQKKVQMKGMSESEMLWKSFQGNEKAMQTAIDKGHIQVQNEMYYWTREFHEHITGGRDSYSTGPQQMTQQDMQKLMELLNFAPWADWAVTPNNIPKVQLKTAATPDSDAIQKAHECLAASKAVCVSMQNFYNMVQSEGILTMQDTGSIPTIMSSAMKKVKEMETEHIQPIADVIYDHDGTSSTSVKDVKDMLGAAAKTLQSLTQYMREAKALVGKYKAALNKKQPFSTAD